MGLFQEYLNSKGKVEKAKVDISGGDPDPKTPPNKPPKGGPAYKCSDGKPKKAGDKGFGDLGEKDLKLKFDLKGKGKAPAKLPTCERIEMASLLAKSCLQDPTLVEDVVRQLKAEGLLGVLVAEMVNHRETFRHLTEIMAHENHGPTICSKLVNAMNEEIAPSFGSQLTDEGEDEEELDAKFGDDENDEDDLDDEGEEGDTDLVDPNTEMGAEAGPPDPNGMPPMMNQDPMMGQDPSAMMGLPPQMPGMPPAMPGVQPPMPGMPPQNPMMPPAMANFQRAMMRSYQLPMMRKV